MEHHDLIINILIKCNLVHSKKLYKLKTIHLLKILKWYIS